MAIGDLARKAREEKGLPPLGATPEDPEPMPEPEPEPEPEPAPPTEAGLLASALLQALKSVQPQGLTKADLSDLMASNAEGMRKALKPENARHPDVSAFNPEGERDHPRPKLKRKTFWAGQELHADDLNTSEITLLNKFEHTKEAKNGAWRAEIRRTGAKGVEELHVTFPCATTDDRMELPQGTEYHTGIEMMLTELHGGSMAVDPMALAARVAELEKQLGAHA